MRYQVNYESYETSKSFDALLQAHSHFGYHQMFSADEQHFLFKERVTRFGGFIAYDFDITGDIKIQNLTISDYLLLVFPLEGDFLFRDKVKNIRVSPGQAFILSPSQSPNFSMPEGTKSLALKCSYTLLRKYLSRTLNFHFDEQLSFPLTGYDPMSVSSFKAAILNIMQNIDNIKNERLREVYIKQSEAYLLTLLITMMENSFHSVFQLTDSFEFPQSIEPAKQYMLKNISDKINLAHLCKATDLTNRSLIYQFKKHTEATPMEYLLSLRLNMLREELKRATAPVKLVDLALKCGLNHAGRVAKQYQQKFGELPSETLKRY